MRDGEFHSNRVIIMVGVTDVSSGRRALSCRGVGLAGSLLLLLAQASYGCGQSSANSGPLPSSEETVPVTSRAQLQPLSGTGTTFDQNDLEFRRGYGIVDMRFDPCVKAQDDQTLHGENCPPGFVVYGPYVNVPANSEIEVTLQIQSKDKVAVYADIVSQMGKQALAGFNPQLLEAGVTHQIGYRVNVFRPDLFVESRIGFRSESPIEFRLTNYTMTVR